MEKILSLIVVLALLSSVIAVVPMPVMAAAEVQPDITVSPASFDVTLAPNGTQSYTLTISNDGSADLTYDISDRETASGQPQTIIEGTPIEAPRIEALGNEVLER